MIDETTPKLFPGETIDDAPPVPEEKTITLRKPVTHATITYAEIKLREPIGAEWEQWDGLSGAAANMKAIAVIAGMPEAAVKQIGTRDLVVASRYLDHFF